MAPYEALYKRKCRTPLCWDEVGERKLDDVELIETTSEKIKISKERLNYKKLNSHLGSSLNYKKL